MEGDGKKWLVSNKEVVLALGDMPLHYVVKDKPLLSQGDLSTGSTCSSHDM